MSEFCAAAICPRPSASVDSMRKGSVGEVKMIIVVFHFHKFLYPKVNKPSSKSHTHIFTHSFISIEEFLVSVKVFYISLRILNFSGKILDFLKGFLISVKDF